MTKDNRNTCACGDVCAQGNPGRELENSAQRCNCGPACLCGSDCNCGR